MWTYLPSYLWCFVWVIPVISHLQYVFSVVHFIGWVYDVDDYDNDVCQDTNVVDVFSIAGTSVLWGSSTGNN